MVPSNYANTPNQNAAKSPGLGKKQLGGLALPTSEVETNEHIQEMKQGESKILVAVRLRPMWKKE